MIEIHPLACDADVNEQSDLVVLLLEALHTAGVTLRPGDVVAVTSKIVSKAEGRVVAFDGTEASKEALIRQESVRVLRQRGSLLITETAHGFVNANAGIDLSNTSDGTAVLLPLDPDKSARRIRAGLTREGHPDVAVLITDTFGRAWRNGVTDIALGIAGLRGIYDLRGTADAWGRTLEVTEVAVADQIAGAANLVVTKAGRTPFVLLRGISKDFFGNDSVQDSLVRRAQDDLFR